MAPQRPGRHAGQGRFSYRRSLSPDQVTEAHHTPLPACPRCGGLLEERTTEDRFQMNLPLVEAVVTRFVSE